MKHRGEAHGSLLLRQKVYDDGWEAIHYKSALTVSLICCALAEKDRGLEKDQKYQDAVHYASEAIFSDYYQINKNFFQMICPSREARTA